MLMPRSKKYNRIKKINEPTCSIEYAAQLINSNKYENERVGLILTGGNYDLNKMPWQK